MRSQAIVAFAIMEAERAVRCKIKAAGGVGSKQAKNSNGTNI
jgi:hypothetical protein